MAFNTLRNTVSYLRIKLRNRKEDRKTGQRNYMKKKQVEDITDPAYRALIEKANDKKAPFAEKTKGYYRFSREFPDKVDTEGYRVNEPNKEKPISRTGIVLMTVGILIVFSVGFIMTDSALEISDAVPPTTNEAQSDVTVDSNFGVVETPTEGFFGNGEMIDDPTITGEAVTAPADETLPTLPDEAASSVVPSFPENTTQFAEAPVEDGQFTTQADSWN